MACREPGSGGRRRLNGSGSIVQFENVGLRYGTGAETLSDLSFSLREGGFYFLTGPSGAGKTSLLKLLYLALRPSRDRPWLRPRAARPPAAPRRVLADPRTSILADHPVSQLPAPAGEGT